ncbi:DUF421 domain-containing protein [Sporolactobacillus sp. THM7-7]|nr:DUF421 domain-containing protein [Sporolactobacillus sp. THM7-7]
MLLFLGKLILLFLIFIAAVKSLGKSALAQLTPHDFGAIIFLAYLAFAAIKVDKVTQSILGVIVLTCTHILISKLNLINWFNNMLIGSPTILITKGQIMYQNLKKSRYPLSELLSSIRAAGYPELKDIEYAILEPNGEISVLPKKASAPVTPKDLKLNIEPPGLPITVIIDGRVQHQNLELLHKDEQWLIQALKEKGHYSIKDILYASVRNTDLQLTVMTKEETDESKD